MTPLSALVALSAHAHVPVVYTTTPDADWCGMIEAALGGDIVMLAPGTYVGPCAIAGKVSDPVGESTIVQSLDPLDPAVLVAGTGDHVLALSGVRIVLVLVAFADLPDGVDAVHVADADEMWIRWCWFDRIGGAVVRQTGDVGAITIENNQAVDVGALAVLGCPGGTCATDTALIEDNLVDGAATGIQVLSPSAVTVRDNVLLGVTGTGVTVSGGDAVLEGNLVESALTAVAVATGPALLRSQILLAPTGIVADGTGGAVRIVGNTVLAAGGSPLVLDGWGPGVGHRLADNAVDAPLPDAGGADVLGNVVCVQPDDCFTDDAAWDFYPSPDSLLRGAGTTDGELLSDWCGTARQDPPTPGALVAFGDLSYGAVPRDAKSEMECAPVDDDPTDPALPLPDDTHPPVQVEHPHDAADVCGCATTGGGAGASLLAVLLAVSIRNRGRTSTLRTGPPDRRSR